MGEMNIWLLIYICMAAAIGIPWIIVAIFDRMGWYGRKGEIPWVGLILLTVFWPVALITWVYREIKKETSDDIN